VTVHIAGLDVTASDHLRQRCAWCGLLLVDQDAVTGQDLAAIRAALQHLPAECRYHGDRIATDQPFRYGAACCETGRSALARRRAEQALARLDDDPAAVHAAQLARATPATPRQETGPHPMNNPTADALRERLQTAVLACLELASIDGTTPLPDPEHEDRAVLITAYAGVTLQQARRAVVLAGLGAPLSAVRRAVVAAHQGDPADALRQLDAAGVR